MDFYKIKKAIVFNVTRKPVIKDVIYTVVGGGLTALWNFEYMADTIAAPLIFIGSILYMKLRK